MDPLGSQETETSRGDRGGQSRPPVLEKEGFHPEIFSPGLQPVTWCFLLFAPDPEEAQATLTERESPTSGNSPIPPAHASTLSHRSLPAGRAKAGPSSSLALQPSRHPPRAAGQAERLSEKAALTETHSTDACQQAAVGLGFISI